MTVSKLTAFQIEEKVLIPLPNPNLGTAVWRSNLGQSALGLGRERSSDWWTGLAPEKCPGISAQGKLHSLTPPNLATCTRDEVRDYFNNTWTLTELLFSSLIGEEPFYRPPYHGLRHPLIFYYVHPAVLYLNKFRVAGLRKDPLDAYFESLFETGVDEMNWDDMSKNSIKWPAIDEAHKYRKLIYSMVLDLINTHPGLADGHAPILSDDKLWALFMGFEHDRIHLETSSVLIRELPPELVARPEHWPDYAALSKVEEPAIKNLRRSQGGNQLLPVSPTKVRLGKPKDWPAFGWDNEYGERIVHVSEFNASQMLISNAEFWQFVSDGGYMQEENWTELGWRWRSFRNVKFPSFWVPDGPSGSHQYRLRLCFEIVPMQWNWPAVVNFHEAQAFCKWKTKHDGLVDAKKYRLLTEAEHQAMRLACKFDNDSLATRPDLAHQPYNLNLKRGSESPVDESKNADDSFCDLFGNVWQWCEDHFNPLPGSRVHPYYDDFSTPCYDGEHQMILGGSFISTGGEASQWARFHFRPHFIQHAGFRIVQSDEGEGGVTRIGEDESTAKTYESKDILNEYMTLHFGSAELQMPYSAGPVEATLFPQRCADLIIEWAQKLSIHTEKALDIGCAVGGSTFRLAETFDQVIGVDLSEQFIKAAKMLQQKRELEFDCKIEADLFSKQKATVSERAAQSSEFRQADACSLPPDFLNFDAVLMANLLCRLPSPSSCLSRMSGPRGIVRPGGILVTVSPYTWMEKFTPKEVWLGGYLDENGEEVFSEDGLKRLLSADFDLLETRDLSLVIREHRRKFQYIVSQALVWRRRP